MHTEEVVSVPQETLHEAVGVPVEPTFTCFVQSKRCAGKYFKATEVYVPNISWLYLVVRNTNVDMNQPLTEDEILPHARCGNHYSGPLSIAYNKKEGIQSMHVFSNTLNLMARYKAKLEHKARKRQERDMAREFKWAQGGVSPAITPKTKNYGSYTNAGGKQKKHDGKKKGKNKNQQQSAKKKR